MDLPSYNRNVHNPLVSSRHTGRIMDHLEEPYDATASTSDWANAVNGRFNKDLPRGYVPLLEEHTPLSNKVRHTLATSEYDHAFVLLAMMELYPEEVMASICALKMKQMQKAPPRKRSVSQQPLTPELLQAAINQLESSLGMVNIKHSVYRRPETMSTDLELTMRGY